MRAWFWTIFLVVLAVALAILIHSYPGNVLIVVDQWRVQVSLAFAILILLTGFCVSYFLIRVMSWMADAPDRYRGWRAGRREKSEQSQLEQGWAALLEGRYEHAEKLLGRLSSDSHDARRKILSQLSAARAAHELGEHARRDDLLEQARVGATGLTHDKSMGVAVAVASADMWLDEGQPAKALDTLKVWDSESSKHVHMMRLLMRCYQALGMHEKVIETTRQLIRKKAISASVARASIETSAAAQLRALQGQPQWQGVWKSLRSEERLYPEIALAGAAGFAAQGETRESTRVLEQAIQNSFDSRVLAAYSQVDDDQVNARLQKAEGWLVKRPDDVDLLMTLGALCLVAQMWGQAQRYLEKASRTRHDSKIHALLGSLHDRLGQSQQAANHWRMATAVSTSLPILAEDVHLPAADLAADPKIHHVEGLVEDDDLAHLHASATGDSIASAHAIFAGSVHPTTADEPASPAAAQHDYEDLFDSAPIPYDGSPALNTSPQKSAPSKPAAKE